MKQKGMLVEVYRSSKDCTNNGVSSKYNKFVLIGKDIPKLFEPTEDTPAIYLTKRCGDFIAIPNYNLENEVMHGGNFIYTSDSRFRRIVGGHPIRIHDRIEKL